MLNLIQVHIGGRVRTVRRSCCRSIQRARNSKDPSLSIIDDPSLESLEGGPMQQDFVLWVVDRRQDFLRIIRIFDSYPPQTSRLRAQLRFALYCLEHNNVDCYLAARNTKYIERDTDMANGLSVEENNHASFFKEWLSGFIESQGSFCIRKNQSCSFSIGQKHDLFLLDKIRTYFGIPSRIRNLKQDFWVLETYRIATLQNLVEHFSNYPLLGEKSISFNKFKKQIQAKLVKIIE